EDEVHPVRRLLPGRKVDDLGGPSFDEEPERGVVHAGDRDTAVGAHAELVEERTSAHLIGHGGDGATRWRFGYARPRWPDPSREEATMLRAPDIGELLQAQQLRRLTLDASGVYFITDIDATHAEDLAKALLVLASARTGRPDEAITLYINSGGGSVGDGLAMIEAINFTRRRYDVRIDTAVLGYAYSMGAIVLQAGDTRSIGRFGTLLLHSSQWSISGEDERVFKDYQRLSEHYQ